MKCCAESRELMPWHLSKSDLRKVYDSYHNMVCVCQNENQSALIVKAVNDLPTADLAPLRLREPLVDQNPAPVVRLEALGPLDTFEPDDSCCGREIAKAARSGVLASLQSWECPKCECHWEPSRIGGIRLWSARPAVAVFR